MAHNGNSEDHTNTASNEQTPLLEDHQSNHHSDQPEEQNGSEQNGDEQNQTRWYIWRIFWAIAAALVLVVYIKGWIDAGGDIDVSTTASYRYRLLPANLYSVGSLT